MVTEHHIINHSEKEYAEGENHINNTENRHSLLRPYLNIFRGVSKKNLNNIRQILPIHIHQRNKMDEKSTQKQHTNAHKKGEERITLFFSKTSVHVFILHL